MNSGTPTLEMDGWELVDGEVAAKQYPDTFLIPSGPDRNSVSAGDRVKLRFLFRAEDEGELPVSETMRVRVSSKNNAKFVGALEDSPVTSGVLRLGQEIHFEPRHVLAIIVPPNDPRHALYAPSAMGRFVKRLRAMIRGDWNRVG